MNEILFGLCAGACMLALAAGAAWAGQQPGDMTLWYDRPASVWTEALPVGNGSMGAMLEVREAQMSMNDVPEFKGNVKAFRTDVLVDKKAEELYKDWNKHIEEWKKVGSDRGYHYLGSAIWYTRIGHAMGEAMLELMKK